MTDVFNLPSPAVRLSLSNDGTSVEFILSDIPFFTVGLLGFGVITFLLAMKRVNLLSVYLYGSILLAFSGGILDLSQVLSRGTANVDKGLGADSVTGIINTREVAFALSVGLRFIFYWTLVAVCPRTERDSSHTQRSTPVVPTTNDRDAHHSASWARWGIQGFILKWVLLVLTIIIPILQIVWRVSPQFHFYCALYLAETTIEIVVSSLFILKLLLNVYLSPQNPWWLPLRSYIAPIIALIFNISVAVGNATSFGLSETTLGRFLQAVELYILVEYLLITTFYSKSLSRLSLLPLHAQENRLDQVSSITEKSRNKSMPSLPPIPVDKSPRHSQQESQTGSKAGRHSRAASRVSIWINSRRSSRRRLSGGEQLWDQGKAELGLADGEQSALAARETPDIVSPLVGEAQEYQQGVPSPALVRSVPRPSDVEISVKSTTDNAQKEPETAEQPPPSFSRKDTVGSVSIPSYYGVSSQTPSPMIAPRPLPSIRPGADSPIYGLNGTTYRPKRFSTGDVRSSDVSIDELLRQQSELDKSIAALRRFSPSDPLPSESGALTPEPISQVEEASRHTSTSEASTIKPGSAAASEFSLSHFPDPPEENVMIMPAPRSRPATMRSTRTTRTIRPRDDAPPLPNITPIEVPRIPQEADSSMPSIPSTPERDDTTPWFGSAGTQYDVTSFIGDLMPPSGALPTESALGSSGTLGGPATATLPTATLQEQYLRDIERRPVLKPLILASSADSALSASVATFQSNATAIPASQPLTSISYHRNGLPPRPRIAISGPRPPLQDSSTRQVLSKSSQERF